MLVFDYLEFAVYFIPFAIIFFATLLLEYLIKGKTIPAFTGRKSLHIIAVFCCAVSVFFAHSRQWHLYIFFGAALLLFAMIRLKIFFSNTDSYGIAFFPLAFAILLSFPFLNRNQIFFTMLTLAFSDAAAGITGYFFAKEKIIFYREPKSWLGCMAFFGSTLLLYLIVFGPNNSWLALAVPAALVPALAELFSVNGSDNLTTPLITGIWVYLLQTVHVENENILLIIPALLLLALAAKQKKILDKTGAAAALLTGLVLCWNGTINYLVAMAFFLLAGGLVSRLNKPTLEKNGRTAVQVFANGLVAIIALLVFAVSKNSFFELAYFASIAVSLCDTVSSEAGKYFKGKTVDILGFRKTPIGISGGISVAGSLASLLAAIVYMVLIFFIYRLPCLQVLLIGIAGFAGMLIDSMLGSGLQALYEKDGQLTESAEGNLVKGKKWCTNDLVNLASNGITMILFLFFCYLSG
jgi:uncharacterized protein (TIGR00297 family)